jgi:hypothetical protein
MARRTSLDLVKEKVRELRAHDYIFSCLDSNAVNTVGTPNEPQVLLAFDLYKHYGNDWPVF